MQEFIHRFRTMTILAKLVKLEMVAENALDFCFLHCIGPDDLFVLQSLKFVWCFVNVTFRHLCH